MQATLNWHSKTSLRVLATALLSKFGTSANLLSEIFRIVSQKALDNGGESAQAPMGDRKVIDVSKSPDAETKKNGCC